MLTLLSFYRKNIAHNSSIGKCFAAIVVNSPNHRTFLFTDNGTTVEQPDSPNHSTNHSDADTQFGSSQSKEENTTLKSAKVIQAAVNGDQAELNESSKKSNCKRMNLSTKQRFANDEDASVPLNLSVKKTSTATSSSAAASSNDSSKLFVPPKHSVNSNNLAASNRQLLSNPFLNHGNQQLNFSAPLIQPQKKRGRKPKALLNNNSFSGNNINHNINNINSLSLTNESFQQQLLNDPSFLQLATNFMTNSGGLGHATTNTHTSTSTNHNASVEPKPRKRGRPPTLSPPHNSLQPMAAHATTSQGGKTNSTSAFAATLNNPFNFLNTPNIPNILNNDYMTGWPGLNALTAAVAASAAAATGNPFSNSPNSFDIFKHYNQKDANNYNLNLMNQSLFNFKNLQTTQESQHDFKNNKASKTERRSKVEDVAVTQSTLKSAANSSSSKTFAHKPHPNEKQLKIPLNHGQVKSTLYSVLSLC